MTMTEPLPMLQPFVFIRKVEAKSTRVASSTQITATQHSSPDVGSASAKFWSDRMKQVGELWAVTTVGAAETGRFKG